MVSNQTLEDATKYIEKACIDKLGRVLAMEKQK